MQSNLDRQRAYRSRRKSGTDKRLDMTISGPAKNALSQIAIAQGATQRQALETMLLNMADVVDRLGELAGKRNQPVMSVFAQLVAEAEDFHRQKSRNARSFYAARNQLLSDPSRTSNTD